MPDQEWFATTYREHYGSVVAYGLRRLGARDAAEELAQEVFVVAWRRRRQAPDHTLPWLYGVARRLLANHWRARRSAPTLVALTDTSSAADPNDAQAALLDVRVALQTLSESDQELLRLIGWEQLTLAEAASVLGCARATAAVRLHRARRRLVAALERSGDSGRATGPASATVTR